VKFVFRSEIGPRTQYLPGEVECLLVNTTGELKHFYEQATVIFIGKSLTAEGGQNPIEPGAWQSHGFWPEHAEFCRSGPRLYTTGRRRSGFRCRRTEKALGDLLSDETRREQLGRNALEVVHKNLGAIDRTADMIIKHWMEATCTSPPSAESLTKS